MVFSSIFFLFLFLPSILLVYYLVPRRYRNFILFVSSLFFYAWGEPIYILLMLFSVVVNYTFGLLITKYKGNHKNAGLLFFCSIFVNVGLLCFFKYYNFLLQTLNALLGTSLAGLDLPLPIGISFYTFQALSYICDVYWGKVTAQRNFIAFGTYLALFPQLIAGPIIRYETIYEQLLQRTEGFDSFGEGIRRFIVGLAKKVLLANNLGLLWSQIQQLPPLELTVLTAWLGIVAFSLQIYFDFSGYSDMALGLGKMFGFAFPENFNYPYISRNITEFWRRWHITLGTWFREYLYIPLGGNRLGKPTLYRNLFFVWFLTGLWHGASWNFILWGLYFGFIIALEKAFLLKWLRSVPSFLSHAYAVLLILLGWVLFSFDNLSLGFHYLQALFGLGSRGIFDQQAVYYLYTNAILLTIALLVSTPYLKNIKQKLLQKSTILYCTAAMFSCLLLLFLSTAYLVDSTYNPFLYFRF
ncbi:MAG: MBOAT family O-acyltransferase [Dethiobacteria bacterium]|jgi:alginate O-acetyltransferase complex protein AlgI